MKAGIVVGFVLVLLIAIACLLVKLKYLPPKEVGEQGRHRKTVAVITPPSGGEGAVRSNRHELITEKSVLLGSYASKFGFKAARRASDESSAKSSLINKRENGLFKQKWLNRQFERSHAHQMSNEINEWLLIPYIFRPF